MDDTCALRVESATLPSEVFVIDRQTLAKTRVSVATNGDSAQSRSECCAINADGTLVTFQSDATNLVVG